MPKKPGDVSMTFKFTIPYEIDPQPGRPAGTTPGTSPAASSGKPMGASSGKPK